MWIYDPEKDKGAYNLPIHENDDMLIGFTFRQIIDETIANYGHNATVEDLQKQMYEHLDMVVEDMQENFALCWLNMLKEVNKND